MGGSGRDQENVVILILGGTLETNILRPRR